MSSGDVEQQLSALLERLDALRRSSPPTKKASMRAEARALEFWRSVIAECLATFFYVFVVCGAAAARPSADAGLCSAVATGLAAAALTHCFGHVSGAHMNPAVTVAMVCVRQISPLRAAMFVTAQCGGAIAGAALLYGVTLPSPLGASFPLLAPALTPWEGFGVELLLAFFVVFTYCVAMDSYRRFLPAAPLMIGAAYLACSLVMMPSLNPARALGPAFVLNKWDHHWVFWFGPMIGGMLSGLIYEFIFNPRRHMKQSKESIDGDSSSIHSDEDPYDELDRPAAGNCHGSTYNTLRADMYRPPINQAGPPTPASPTGPGNVYCPSLTSASLYSAPPCRLDRVENLYGGTKSLYAKSPPLTRANLNRSQSVYTKVPTAGQNPREGIPRPGPLVPAQSLYPMRLSQSQNMTNQAVQDQNQNQQNLRSESIYGVRGVSNANRVESGNVYGLGHGNSNMSNAGGKFSNTTGRPESMYGIVSRRQDSADSSYGSYHSGGTGSNANSCSTRSGSNTNNEVNRRCVGGQGRNDSRQQHQMLSAGVPTSVVNPANSVASYHHNQRHSPNPQY